MIHSMLVGMGFADKKDRAQRLALRMLAIMIECLLGVIVVWFFTVQSHLVFIEMTHDRYTSTMTLLATFLIVINGARMLVLNAQVFRGKNKSLDE